MLSQNTRIIGCKFSLNYRKTFNTFLSHNYDVSIIDVTKSSMPQEDDKISDKSNEENKLLKTSLILKLQREIM